MRTGLPSLVFLVWFALSCATVLLFLLVSWRSARKPASIPYRLVNRRRFVLFFVFSTAFLGIFVAATMRAPYSARGEADEIIGVKARAFSFDLTKDTVSCGRLVEFRVSAEDVTHGFGIYTSEGTLLGQVQAMPGYVNRLRVKFEKPGPYQILCLEYCGPLHHLMRASLTAR